MIKTFLNAKGHQNPINGPKVTAILLKGWILPIGGASAVEGLRSTGLPRLVFYIVWHMPCTSAIGDGSISALPNGPIVTVSVELD